MVVFGVIDWKAFWLDGYDKQAAKTSQVIASQKINLCWKHNELFRGRMLYLQQEPFGKVASSESKSYFGFSIYVIARMGCSIGGL